MRAELKAIESVLRRGQLTAVVFRRRHRTRGS